MRVLLLIATQRTGTNYLRALLGGHPAIQADLGEVFQESERTHQHPANFWSYLLGRCREWPEAWLPVNRQRVMLDFMQFIEAEATGRSPLLDIKYNSLHHGNSCWVALQAAPILIRQAGALELPVIHLRRKNTLRMVISRHRANSARQYTLKPKEANATTAITVDPRSVLVEIEYHQREAEHVSVQLKHYCRTLEIEYTQLWQDMPGGIRNFEVEDAIMRHCQVEPIRLPDPPLVKMTPHSLEDAVANWTELKAAMLDSPFAWMLDEEKAATPDGG